jgi:hypothetical protein
MARAALRALPLGLALMALAQAALAASSTVVSFGTLPALQVTTPIPGSNHTPGDFNGDGTSDILWFNPSTSQLSYWTMTATVAAGSYGGGVTRTGMKTFNVTPGYFVGAVGDFNGDGYADLVFTSANHDLWLWTNTQLGGWTSNRINNSSYPSQWQLIGAGDVDGDGHDDLLWLDPSECKFGYWTMNGATVTSYHTIDIACGYYPVSIGYYTPSNRLSIIWTSAAKDFYIWDSTGNTADGNTGNGFNAYNLTPYLPANSRLMSAGGGYQGQNLGFEFYQLSTDGTYDAGEGLVLSRSFDANNHQTGIQTSIVWDGAIMNPSVGSTGYVIAGNGVNNSGIYYMDPVNMVISTGGLLGSNNYFSGNVPFAVALDRSYAFGDNWTYSSGWWVVGALFNGTVAPPWQ